VEATEKGISAAVKAGLLPIVAFDTKSASAETLSLVAKHF
jgi:hypothetical protein